MFRIAFAFVFLTLTQLVFSQSHVSRYDLRTGVRKLTTPNSVTSIVVRLEKFQGSTIVIRLNGKALEVPFDPDGEDYSYFISFDPVETPNG